ncbi:MAG: hypothetical protein HFH08_03940 [Bacilli bacterium]|nr:hypothetical protein [Bacilli bacterium]
MNLLNIQEYKRQYPVAHLSDYIQYLEEKQKEVEEILKNSRSFSLNNTILEKIGNQSKEIGQMRKIIESRLWQPILNSIAQLSLEELQSYFDSCNRKEKLEEKRGSAVIKRLLIEESLSDLNWKIESITNSRSIEWYQQTDAITFFEDYITPEQISYNLLSVKNPEDLENVIRRAFETENDFQKMALEGYKLDSFVRKFINLLKQSRNIIEYVPDAKEKLSHVFMTKSGIGRILSSEFDSQTPTFLAYDLMNYSKMQTTFYQSLPFFLQEWLQEEHFAGKTYQILKQGYQEYKQGKKSGNEDMIPEKIVQSKREEQEQLKESLNAINDEITCIEKEIETLGQFLDDAETMRTTLTTAIQSTIETSQVSVDEINVAINETEKATKALKEKLLEVYQELLTKNENLKKARTILTSPDYHSFFQAVEENQMHRIYEAVGVDVPEKMVIPFVEAEEKRYKQIHAMISIQTELEEAYNLISEKKGKSNCFMRQLPSYKKTVKRFNYHYQQILECGFKMLQENDLFSICAPQISMGLTMENVICLPAKVSNHKPESFDEVNGLKQIFWDMNGGIGTNTRKRFLSANPSFDDWDSYVQFLMQTQQELVMKLFHFSKDEEGYYHFQLTDEERKTLLATQKTIIDIAKSTYQERKEFRENLGNPRHSLDEDKKATLESILGNENLLSRENLVIYIENTALEITQLKNLLFSNRALCVELGIPITLEEASKVTEPSNELESKIRNLNIEGITTLQDAILYRDILVGLNQYPTFSNSEIKQFYLAYKLASK